ncbi:hypothetical protein C8J57DRAFT_1526307 [Mycena rebaudengoi]|nr:hypothetical protein C8J57DRAFT_1526307 [Mycena rebaudengoi]
MTAFMTPLGFLRITSMPTRYTNSPAEFQWCMTFVLHDEIPHVVNIFINDVPIKAPHKFFASAATPGTHPTRQSRHTPSLCANPRAVLRTPVHSSCTAAQTVSPLLRSPATPGASVTQQSHLSDASLTHAVTSAAQPY